jgi:hypothetical protein
LHSGAQSKILNTVKRQGPVLAVAAIDKHVEVGHDRRVRPQIQTEAQPRPFEEHAPKPAVLLSVAEESIVLTGKLQWRPDRTQRREGT